MSSEKNSLEKSNLTLKQKAFCLEYLKDLNATQAAIRAGYSEKTARQQGAQNLSNLNMQRHIQKLNTQRTKETKVDANFVLSELEKIANSDVKEMFDENDCMLPLSKIPKYLRKAISSFEVVELYAGRGADRQKIGELKKVKLWSKDKALENLGKHLRLFADKVEHSNPDGSLQPQITVYLPSNNREKIINERQA